MQRHHAAQESKAQTPAKPRPARPRPVRLPPTPSPPSHSLSPLALSLSSPTPVPRRRSNKCPGPRPHPHLLPACPAPHTLPARHPWSGPIVLPPIRFHSRLTTASRVLDNASTGAPLRQPLRVSKYVRSLAWLGVSPTPADSSLTHALPCCCGVLLLCVPLSSVSLLPRCHQPAACHLRNPLACRVGYRTEEDLELFPFDLSVGKPWSYRWALDLRIDVVHYCALLEHRRFLLDTRILSN